MADWGPVFIAAVLFMLLTPGLLIKIPGGRGKIIKFGSFETSVLSILVHAVLYLAFICIFLMAIGIHVYIG